MTTYSSLPDAATLKRSLDEFIAATDKIAVEREEYNRDAFGQCLTKAVRALLHPRFTATASTTADERPTRTPARFWTPQPPPSSQDDESGGFAQKLCEAVQRQLGSRSRQHKNTTAASSDDDETFAQKLTRIAKEKAKQRNL
jgi:hypothetical protein